MVRKFVSNQIPSYVWFLLILIPKLLSSTAPKPTFHFFLFTSEIFLPFFPTSDLMSHFIQSNVVVDFGGIFLIISCLNKMFWHKIFLHINHSRADFGTTLLLIESFNVNLMSYFLKQFTSSLFIKSITYVYKHSRDKNIEELPVLIKWM